MQPNSENAGKHETEKGEVLVRIKPMRLVVSVAAIAGSALIIIGGAKMLGIEASTATNAGEIANTYYHGLGLGFIGFGVIIAALGVGSCYKSLTGQVSKK
jgi:hypothetical protein